MLRDGLRQMHRFGRSGAFIEQRGVRDLEPGQVRHHRLEVEERLQPALRDLRLIRRIGRVPPGVFQHVALDDRGRETVVIPHTEVGTEDLILCGELAERVERFLFGPRFRNPQRPRQPDVCGHDGVDKRVERIVAEDLQHGRLVLGRGPDVSFLKQIAFAIHLTGV